MFYYAFSLSVFTSCQIQYCVWYCIVLSSTLFLAKGQRCKNNPLLCILEAETLLTFILFSASVLRGLAVTSMKQYVSAFDSASGANVNN